MQLSFDDSVELVCRAVDVAVNDDVVELSSLLELCLCPLEPLLDLDASPSRRGSVSVVSRDRIWCSSAGTDRTSVVTSAIAETSSRNRLARG